jgi:hypothetical protein
MIFSLLSKVKNMASKAEKASKQNEMFALIESWRSSDQDQHQFCKERNIAYHVFHYWYKKYRTGQPSSIPVSEFISLNLSPSTSGSAVLELIAPSGKRVKFYQKVDASFLRSLLE